MKILSWIQISNIVKLRYKDHGCNEQNEDVGWNSQDFKEFFLISMTFSTFVKFNLLKVWLKLPFLVNFV